jgi:hypothetical protein
MIFNCQSYRCSPWIGFLVDAELGNDDNTPYGLLDPHPLVNPFSRYFQLWLGVHRLTLSLWNIGRLVLTPTALILDYRPKLIADS